MGCKIVFAPQAIADLEAIVRYLAKADPITAERIGNALIDRVAILQNFPLIGPPYPKRPGVRKLVCRPYVIFYRASPGEGRVDVLRYWHGAQEEPHLNE
jgi:addiction module RelE/StbE family toxin